MGKEEDPTSRAERMNDLPEGGAGVEAPPPENESSGPDGQGFCGAGL